MKNKFRTQFDDDYSAEKYGISFNPKAETERSQTKQHFAEECDINNIMERYEKTGVLPEATRQLLYGDFSDVGSFQEAQDIVLLGRAQFDALPARVRDRFGNDPAKFLAFCEDESNRDEMITLGLIDKPEAPAPAKGEAGTPAPSAAAEDKISTASKA